MVSSDAEKETFSDAEKNFLKVLFSYAFTAGVGVRYLAGVMKSLRDSRMDPKWENPSVRLFSKDSTMTLRSVTLKAD